MAREKKCLGISSIHQVSPLRLRCHRGMLMLFTLMLSMEAGHVHGQLQRDGCQCNTDSCLVDGELTLAAEIYESNTNLTATCTIVSQEPRQPCTFSSRDVYFKYLNREVDPEFVRVVNGTTVQLEMPGLSRDKSAAHLYCKLRGYVRVIGSGYRIPENIGQKSVIVADLPKAPNITQCTVYNWESMECLWEPTFQDTGILTNTTLYWTVLPEEGWFSCLHVLPGSGGCMWPASSSPQGGQGDSFKRDFRYNLSLVTSNKLGKATTTAVIESKLKVKPNPVDIQVTEIQQTNITIKWAHPSKKYAWYVIVYNITLQSQWGSSKQENVTSREKELEYTFKNLVPFTNYTIHINCIPKVGGFPSNTTSVSVRTNRAVPGAAPRVSAGGFMVKPRPPHTRDVTVVWQPLLRSQTHGENVTTRVRVYRRDHFHGDLHCGNPALEVVPVNVVMETRSATLTVPANQSLQICVDQGNEIGFNDGLDLRPILVPAVEKNFPQFHVESDRNRLIVTWLPLEGAAGYTVFWCPSYYNLKCKNGHQLEWQDFSNEQTTAMIDLPPEEHAENYHVAMSTQYLENNQTLVGSGMVVAYAIFEKNTALQPPSELVAAPKQNEDGQSLTIRWRKPEAKNTGYISHFTVSYCSSPCAGQDGQAVTVPVERELDGDIQRYTLRGLRHGVPYNITICSSNSRTSRACASINAKVTWEEMSRTHVVLIVFGIFVGLLLLGATLYTALRYCRKNCIRKPIEIIIDDIDIGNKFNYPGDLLPSKESYTQLQWLGPDDDSRHMSDSTDSSEGDHAPMIKLHELQTNGTLNGGLPRSGAKLFHRDSESRPLVERQVSTNSSLEAYNRVTQAVVPSETSQDSKLPARSGLPVAMPYIPKSRIQSSDSDSTAGVEALDASADSSIMPYSMVHPPHSAGGSNLSRQDSKIGTVSEEEEDLLPAENSGRPSPTTSAKIGGSDPLQSLDECLDPGDRPCVGVLCVKYSPDREADDMGAEMGAALSRMMEQYADPDVGDSLDKVTKSAGVGLDSPDAASAPNDNNNKTGFISAPGLTDPSRTRSLEKSRSPDRVDDSGSAARDDAGSLADDTNSSSSNPPSEKHGLFPLSNSPTTRLPAESQKCDGIAPTDQSRHPSTNGRSCVGPPRHLSTASPGYVDISAINMIQAVK